jgi:hypothetical protein
MLFKSALALMAAVAMAGAAITAAILLAVLALVAACAFSFSRHSLPAKEP